MNPARKRRSGIYTAGREAGTCSGCAYLHDGKHCGIHKRDIPSPSTLRCADWMNAKKGARRIVRWKIQVPGPFGQPLDLEGIYDTRAEAMAELREMQKDIPDFEGVVVTENTPGDPA